MKIFLIAVLRAELLLSTNNKISHLLIFKLHEEQLPTKHGQHLGKIHFLKMLVCIIF